MATGVSQEDGKRRIRRCFNGRLFFSVTIIFLSQVNFGLDITAFSTTQAMDSFEKKFGVYSPSLGRIALEPYYLSLLNSLTYIGQVAGLFFGSFVSRKYGRRMAFFIMCGWAWVSAAVLVSAQHKEQVLVGRILNYIYIGMELAAVPITQSELVPAEVRGMVVGTYQLGIVLGTIIMSSITLGTSAIPSDVAWRVPMGLLFIIPTIVFIGTFWIPESPRWLLIKHRPEEARQNLKLLRQGRYSDEEIDEEFRVLAISLEEQVEKGRFPELWKGANLKRTLIAIGCNFFLQSTGQSFVSSYGSVFVKDIGVFNPFIYKLITAIANLTIVLSCMYFSDILGRRPMLLIGSLGQMTSMMIMGGLGTMTPLTKPVKSGIVTMLAIFGLSFNAGWGPMSHVVAAEIPASRLRDLTYATASIVNICTNLIVNMVIPYLLYAPYANLGPKVGFVWGSFAIVAAIYVIWLLPECKCLTLEEVDYLFNQKVPLRKFKDYKTGHILPVQVNEDSEKAQPTVVEREMAL